MALARTLPRWAAPLLALVLIGAGLATVIALAGRAAQPDLPPLPAAFRTPTPSRAVHAFDVQQASGGQVALSGVPAAVMVRRDAQVEALRPATAAEVAPGMWLAVIGIPNEVRTFAIRSLVLIPDPAPPGADGIVRSRGGFAGHEAGRDQAERPLLGGIVERIQGNEITLRGPDGPISITLTAAAPLRLLEQSAASAIREGDRIATLDAPSVADSTAVLVLPGGAR